MYFTRDVHLDQLWVNEGWPSKRVIVEKMLLIQKLLRRQNVGNIIYARLLFYYIEYYI